jgi:hypothetical protein
VAAARGLAVYQAGLAAMDFIRFRSKRTGIHFMACLTALTAAGAATASAEPPRMTLVDRICTMNPISLHLPLIDTLSDKAKFNRTRIATPLRNHPGSSRTAHYPGPCEVDARPDQVAWLVGLNDLVEVVWFDVREGRAQRQSGQAVRWRGMAGETSIEIDWGEVAHDQVLSADPVQIAACNRDGCARLKAVSRLQITNSF